MKESKKQEQPELLTSRQQRSLHLYFSLLATELNAAGLNVQLVLEKKMDIDWTPELVKNILWRPAQIAILQKYSTTKLHKIEEIDKVYDHLTRHLGTLFGVSVPFPHFDKPSDYDKFTAS